MLDWLDIKLYNYLDVDSFTPFYDKQIRRTGLNGEQPAL